MILGSASPRRKEILQFFTIPFTAVPSHFDEEQIPFLGSAHDYVTLLAESKAKCLTTQFPEEIIICADTVVYLEGKVYNKPKDKAEAAKFLGELSGKWHEVVTGVCIVKGSLICCEAETTRILFNTLSNSQIEQYLTHFAYSDKAGGYAIQQGGGIIVKKIEGCYYNVMGLPINTLSKILASFDIDLWKHLKIF